MAPRKKKDQADLENQNELTSEVEETMANENLDSPQEEPRETYPSAIEKAKDLQHRASNFIKEQASQLILMEDSKSNDENDKKEDTDSSTENTQVEESAKLDPAEGKKSDEESNKASQKEESNAESKSKVEKITHKEEPAKPTASKDGKGKAMLLGGLVGAIIASLLVGALLNGKQVGTVDNHKPTAQEQAVADNAIKNIVHKDSMYDCAFEVKNVDNRIDGLYVTVSMTNDSRSPVYFMANSMKMIGKDGRVYLPVLGKGQVPSSFTGGGVAPTTTEEATFVFDSPANLQPDSFILENVTNLKNGSWTFQIKMDK